MPGECECDTAACALRITGQVNLEACGTPGGVPLTGFVSASLLTATTETASGENDACDASASVADLNISLGDPLPDITATLLSSSVSAPCDCGTPTTSGEVVGLMIGGTQVTSDTQITVDTLTLVVALNEVICGEDGRITRRALRIEAVSEAPVFTIIAGESAARAASCPECSA